MVSPFMARVIAWEKAKTALDIAKVTEKNARDALLQIDMAEAGHGTTSIPLDDGRVLKCVKATEFAAVKDNALVDTAIAKLKALGNEGTFIADRLFSTAWKVSVTELKKLEAKYRKIADKAIVAKPKSPELEIVVPKAS
jgi:hypothetical protein